MPPGETVDDANWLHNGFAPAAGAPARLRAISTRRSAAGTGNDYYALARSTIGTPYQVNLRFDLVKSAVNQVITTMQADNLPINNLKVGIFWFADILTKVYPATGEAGNDWATALADVGGPADRGERAGHGDPAVRRSQWRQYRFSDHHDGPRTAR